MPLSGAPLRSEAIEMPETLLRATGSYGRTALSATRNSKDPKTHPPLSGKKEEQNESEN